VIAAAGSTSVRSHATNEDGRNLTEATVPRERVTAAHVLRGKRMFPQGVEHESSLKAFPE
jgi:hypothetical protein